MRILGIDTSTMTGSVAIVEDERLVAEEILSVDVTHSERVIQSVDMVIKGARLSFSDIDGFGVAIGPGSFTGLRIGVAAVKGFVFSTNKPMVGVSSLLALAYNLASSSKAVAAVIDARRGEVYLGVYRFTNWVPEEVLKDTVLSPQAALDAVSRIEDDVVFVGDGIYLMREMIEGRFGRSAIPPAPFRLPRASNVAWIAASKMMKGEVDDPMSIRLNYIRKSDAEIKFGGSA